MLEKMQEVAFQIIGNTGAAKSMYIEAVSIAKTGDITGARTLVEDAQEMYNEAHKFHFEIIQKETNGEQLPFSIIFMHAEDQLLNTETVKMMTVELIDVHEKINNLL